MTADCHTPAAPSPAAPTGAPLVVLVGRPNAGKSALYNRLTGGDAHVGNFPGITTDVLEGAVALPGGGDARLVDLPGVYSLDAAVDPATDEGVARAFLSRAGADAVALVVQVVDGNRLGLGLRLTRELLARPVALLVVVTQADVVHAEGHAIDREALEGVLGVPVIVVSAKDPGAKPTVLAAMRERLASDDATTRPEPDWDPDALALDVVSERHDADAKARARRDRTERADAWLLHPVLGPIVFVSIMAATFAAVFLIADPASGALGAAIAALAAKVGPWLGQGWLRSLVVDGVLGGAGTVLGFMPQIVVLGVAIELLESTGYLARGAFLVDRLLRTAGLGGRSFVPLLMGNACAIPAITATRIVRNPRERLATILVVPLMTCSARIPTYALLVAAFFPRQGSLFRAGVFVGLYFAGVGLAVVAAAVLRRTAVRGRGLPMVLEMPAYRAPEPRTLARVVVRSARTFLHDVGRTIVVASVVLWCLLNVPQPGARFAVGASAGEHIEHSVAAAVGRGLEPVTRPLGFDWRINVGLIGSFGARELMVSTLGVIFGLENATEDPAPLAARLRDARAADGRPAYPIATGLALLAFFVVACQCMSTVAVIRRETRGWRWPLFTLAYTYALGWALALLVHRLAVGVGLG